MSKTPDKPAEPGPESETEETARGADPHSDASPGGAGPAEPDAPTPPGSNPPAERSPVPPAAPPTPRFDAGSLLWTVIWAVILALGIAAGATTWERIERRAAGRNVLLLPSIESSEADRGQWLQVLLEDLDFESGKWLSPKSLVEQVSATVPREMWAELFSESDAWLPWLLRLQPADPLEDLPGFRTQLGKLRDDPRFRLVLYDEAALQNDARQYARVRRGTFIAAGVLALAGVIALLFSPFTARWRFDLPGGMVLAVGLTALGWYGLLQAGIEVDREQGLRALATAFGLAGVIGPMLKGRITQYLRRRGEKYHES